jgi:twitching motility protein PilU
MPTPSDSPDIAPLLRRLAERGGSDMFFSVGAPPHLKQDGACQPLETPPLAPGEVRRLVWPLLSAEQRAEFEREKELNLAVDLEGIGRFRLNLYLQRGEPTMVARYVKSEIPSIAELGLPPVLEKLALRDRGLILVVGAAGSGKSTTLAAMLEQRNRSRSGHILCIEDPIEFVHRHRRSLIDQREVGLDTHSFAAALRNILREAPDVIMIGEIRDLETMQHALHYAETGHLCLATLHATGATQAIERIVHFFPENARGQVLADVAQNLLAIVAQRPVPGLDRHRAMAVELLLSTPHLRDLIQRDQLREIRQAIAEAPEPGLQTFDQHLFQLHEAGRISAEEAVRHADSRTDLSLRIRLEHAAEESGPEFRA